MNHREHVKVLAHEGNGAVLKHADSEQGMGDVLGFLSLGRQSVSGFTHWPGDGPVQ